MLTVKKKKRVITQLLISATKKGDSKDHAQPLSICTTRLLDKVFNNLFSVSSKPAIIYIYTDPNVVNVFTDN